MAARVAPIHFTGNGVNQAVMSVKDERTCGHLACVGLKEKKKKKRGFAVAKFPLPLLLLGYGTETLISWLPPKLVTQRVPVLNAQAQS